MYNTRVTLTLRRSQGKLHQLEGSSATTPLQRNGSLCALPVGQEEGAAPTPRYYFGGSEGGPAPRPPNPGAKPRLQHSVRAMPLVLPAPTHPLTPRPTDPSTDATNRPNPGKSLTPAAGLPE
jgi:hypothetical protein